MRKSLIALPIVAALAAAPATASAGENWFVVGNLNDLFGYGLFDDNWGYDNWNYVDRHDHSKPAGKIRKRMKRQKKRIRKGIESGQLTRKEAKKLRRQQRRIGDLHRDYRSDGHLSRTERRDLTERLDRASDRIYRLKHNDRKRGDRYYSYRYDD